ncbi:uncharacterized protein LOC126831057 [Patella vulgata]|uniref:uncharacterized protein LOC126831057 n=1 Tax=Patella vulgata TaxID=6465 RepID=UPI0024A8B5B7|nr:uncharacterized protein LOC126831057 [Patella vulgata]
MDKLLYLGLSFGLALNLEIVFVKATITESPSLLNNEGLPRPNAVQMPSWIKCMRLPSMINATRQNLALGSLHWCSNVDLILPCLEEGLLQTAQNNPLDFFASLNKSPGSLKQRSDELCSTNPEYTEDLNCARNRSEIGMAECSMQFKQSVDYLYFIRNMQDITEEMLITMACDITSETSRCMNREYSSCSVETRQFLLGYYGLFTNTECVYNASLPDEPPRLPTPVEETILMKCGLEASLSVNMSSRPPLNSTVQAVIITVLLEDCRLYRQRFQCFEREFPAATTFLDVWQKQTFNLERAIAANDRFCANTNEFVSKLTSSCVNSFDRLLQVCERAYGVRIGTAELNYKEDNTSFDLKQEACNASVERVKCLKEAIKTCGDYETDEYSTSQYEMLPDFCLQQTSTQSINDDTESLPNTTGRTVVTARPVETAVDSTTRPDQRGEVTDGPSSVMQPETTNSPSLSDVTKQVPQDEYTQKQPDTTTSPVSIDVTKQLPQDKYKQRLPDTTTLPISTTERPIDSTKQSKPTTLPAKAAVLGRTNDKNAATSPTLALVLMIMSYFVHTL